MSTRVFIGVNESIAITITTAAVLAGGYILVTEGHSVVGQLAIMLGVGVLLMYFYIITSID